MQEHIIYSTDRAKFAATSQALTTGNTAAAVYMTHKLLHTLRQVLHQPAVLVIIRRLIAVWEDERSKDQICKEIL